MHKLFVLVSLLSVVAICNAASGGYSGPYLFWGHEKVLNLQPRALVEASEEDFATLYEEAKAIVIFVRPTWQKLNGATYPKLQNLVKENAWSYLPQQSLAVEPDSYNTNIEIINLSGSVENEDEEILLGFNDAVSRFGKGEVLAILAQPAAEHSIAKRQAKPIEADEGSSTTPAPASEETDENFIYVADGQKAILYVTTAPVLNISNESFKLVEHLRQITFDDRSDKARLNIPYTVDKEKLFVRFGFALNYGTWSMKEVTIEYKDYKNVLPIVGTMYTVPSAPIGFSYRCSSQKMVFTDGNDTLVLSDYQLQPWLNGASKFGDVYDCVGFVTSPILAGILVTFFLCGILVLGLTCLLDIKTPNRFESSRNKQLTFTVQD